MREIKFRAWDKKHKNMVYAGEFEDEVITFYGEPIEVSLGMINHNYYFEPLSYILMQYTGLKDKNGREIYDGDSFTAKHRSGREYKGYIQKGLSFEFVIKNYSEDFIDGEGFKETDFTFDINSFVQYFPADDFEVIGNIYENPELLEQS